MRAYGTSTTAGASFVWRIPQNPERTRLPETNMTERLVMAHTEYNVERCKGYY